MLNTTTTFILYVCNINITCICFMDDSIEYDFEGL